MKLRTGEWILLLCNLAYILGFSFYFLSIQNLEFLWYVAVLVFFFGLVLATLRKSKFDYTILWGLSIWGFLHMAGGSIPVGDTVLYGYQLIPLINNGGDFIILKFDQLVHTFGFAVATLVVYHLLKPSLGEKPNWAIVYATLIFAGMGLGVLNEIVEFIAVLIFPETGVGGYINTALDLVFNTIGAVLAVIVIHLKRK